MTEITREQLINILKDNLDYVLELSILKEPELCSKPVHKFGRAFADGKDFCLIYSEADDPEVIFASYNSGSSRKLEKILLEHKISRIINHGGNDGGESCESYYYNSRDNIGCTFKNIRLLTPDDKNLAEPESSHDYINIIFEDFIIDKIWHDCGIIGIFDDLNNFAGYLAYYQIAENIRDVSYIYIKSRFRSLGYAKKLLNYFKHKNISENNVSYYSCAADKASANLAESCGFISCAKRYEREIKI